MQTRNMIKCVGMAKSYGTNGVFFSSSSLNHSLFQKLSNYPFKIITISIKKKQAIVFVSHWFTWESTETEAYSKLQYLSYIHSEFETRRLYLPYTAIICVHSSLFSLSGVAAISTRQNSAVITAARQTKNPKTVQA